MEIRRLTGHDKDQLQVMRAELFPDEDRDWPIDEYLSPGGVVVGAFGSELVGYAAAQLRSHAEGAWDRPAGEQRIAYLEEWYVRPGHRRRGVGAALVAEVEAWARGAFADYLASDTDIGNDVSVAAHRSIGFEEVERAVHFLRELEPRPNPAELPPADAIELRQLDNDSGTDMMRLTVAPSQRMFVADNKNTLARAFLNDGVWVRGIYAGDLPVGLAMLGTSDGYYLWRFMVDYRYQGRGYGRRAMELIIDHVRQEGGVRLGTSVVPRRGGPGPFYERLGFVPTGESDEWEVELVLDLGS